MEGDAGGQPRLRTAMSALSGHKQSARAAARAAERTGGEAPGGWPLPRLVGAAAGIEGKPLETEADWHSLAPERAAVHEAMRAQQRELLPLAAWRLIEDAIHDAEEMPPRLIAPSPAHAPDPNRASKYAQPNPA